MVKPPQPGSLVRREETLGPLERRTLLSRIVGREPSEAAPYLRAILAGLKDAGAKQLEQIPVLGPLLSGAGAALLELSSEEDDAILEERLAEILETGHQSRETLEALTALSTAIYLQQNALLARLESAGFPAQPAQLTAVALSTALAAYRGRVARDYQYADHRGIEGGTRAEHAASLPLDEVYVLPRLVPERSQADSRERENRLLKDLLDNEDLAPGDRSRREEEFALLTGERWRALKEKEKAKTIAEALGSVRHAVVIGSPGVGKSAMTRFLARTCALGGEALREKLGWEEDLTPVVLPLAGYADAKSRQAGLTLREHLDARLAERGGDALREAVGAELQAGRVLVLFDGVDEIPDSRERILVVKAVDQFLADHAANRFVVTSRPYGYVRLAGEIPHFQLPNFVPEQVAEFVQRWQKAFERWRHPEAPDFAQAGKQADEMLEEIRRNPKVEELATNPLMLVIFALIRHEQARLPEERVQLYNRAVNTLMDSWNRGRCLAGIDVGGAQLPLDRLVRVWSRVAEWTRRTKPTGVVHRAELKSKLIEILREEELDEEDPAATAESYLNAAADRAGLLEERGKDIFAFWHPTFEEFLAAVEVTTPSARAIERILPLRDDPRWREVILLAVGYLGIVQRDRETATALVRAIWKEDPGPLEPLLHSHLRLAAACIADDVGVKRSLAEEVIVALGAVVCELPYGPFIESFSQTVSGVPGLRPTEAMVRALEPLADHPDWRVRMEVARLWANVAGDVPQARSICLRLLEDGDPDVQCHAAFGLLRAGLDSPEAWRAFAGFRSSLARLKKAGEHWLATVPQSRILSSLEPLLTGTDGELRWRAAEVLRGLGGEPSQVLSALEPLLTGTNGWLRWQATEVLRRLGVEASQVLSVLEPLLTGTDGELRWRAASVLSGLGVEASQVLSALEPLLTGTDEWLRWQATEVLRGLGGEPSQVLSALEPLLTGTDGWLRLRAAEVLSGLGGEPSQVLSALEPLLAGSAGELRLRAAEVLGRVGGEPTRVLSALEPLLTGSDGELRLRAAEVLSGLGGEPPQVLSALEPLLTGTDGDLRWRAAEVLSRFGGEPSQVLSALEPLLTGSDQTLAWRAVRLALPLIAPAAVEACVKRLAKKPRGSLACCKKVLYQKSMTDEEGKTLAALVQARRNETEQQKEARALLFNWLYGRLQAVASSA